MSKTKKKVKVLLNNYFNIIVSDKEITYILDFAIDNKLSIKKSIENYIKIRKNKKIKTI